MEGEGMFDRRTFPRADWVRLYGRSFRRTSVVDGHSSDCQHEQAMAFEGARRKDRRYTVEVECGCGAKEIYQMGVPFGEAQFFQMTEPVSDDSLVPCDSL